MIEPKFMALLFFCQGNDHIVDGKIGRHLPKIILLSKKVQYCKFLKFLPELLPSEVNKRS